MTDKTDISNVTVTPNRVKQEYPAVVTVQVDLSWSEEEVDHPKEFTVIVECDNKELVFDTEIIKVVSGNMFPLFFTANITATQWSELPINITLYDPEFEKINHWAVEFLVDKYPCIEYYRVAFPVIVISSIVSIPFGSEQVVTGDNFEEIFHNYTFSGHGYIRYIVYRWLKLGLVDSVTLENEVTPQFSMFDTVYGWVSTPISVGDGNTVPDPPELYNYDETYPVYDVKFAGSHAGAEYPPAVFYSNPIMRFGCDQIGTITIDHFNIDSHPDPATPSRKTYDAVYYGTAHFPGYKWQMTGTLTENFDIRILGPKYFSEMNEDQNAARAKVTSMLDTPRTVTESLVSFLVTARDVNAPTDDPFFEMGTLVLSDGLSKLTFTQEPIIEFVCKSPTSIQDVTNMAVSLEYFGHDKHTHLAYMVDGAYSHVYRNLVVVGLETENHVGVPGKAYATHIFESCDPTCRYKLMGFAKNYNRGDEIGRTVQKLPQMKVVSSDTKSRPIRIQEAITGDRRFSLSYGSKTYDFKMAFGYLGLMGDPTRVNVDKYTEKLGEVWFGYDMYNYVYRYHYNVYNIKINRLFLSPEQPNKSQFFLYPDDIKGDWMTPQRLRYRINAISECEDLMDDVIKFPSEVRSGAILVNCDVLSMSTQTSNTMQRHGYYSDVTLFYHIRDVSPYKYSEDTAAQTFGPEFWAKIEYSEMTHMFTVTIYDTALFGDDTANSFVVTFEEDTTYSTKGFFTVYLLEFLTNLDNESEKLQLELWVGRDEMHTHTCTIEVSGVSPITVSGTANGTYAYSHPSPLDMSQYCYCVPGKYDPYGLIHASIRYEDDKFNWYFVNVIFLPISSLIVAEVGLEDETGSPSSSEVEWDGEMAVWFAWQKEAADTNLEFEIHEKFVYDTDSSTGKLKITMENLPAGIDSETIKFDLNKCTSSLTIGNVEVSLNPDETTDTELIFDLPNTMLGCSGELRIRVDLTEASTGMKMYLALQNNAIRLVLDNINDPLEGQHFLYIPAVDIVTQEQVYILPRLKFYRSVYLELNYTTITSKVEKYIMYSEFVEAYPDQLTSDYMKMIPGIDIVGEESLLYADYGCYFMYSVAGNDGHGALRTIRRQI